MSGQPKPTRARNSSGGVVDPKSSSATRRSLQEEPDAFYRHLSVGVVVGGVDEEQAIRMKYDWFPPSLTKLSLVDEFFSQFASDKIPYKRQSSCSSPPAPPTTSTSPSTSTRSSTSNSSSSSSSSSSTSSLSSSLSSSPASSSGRGEATRLSLSSKQDTAALCIPKSVSQSKATLAKEANPEDQQADGPSNKVARNLSHSSSYRDEQISFQLPRQDVSLDYCSYPLDEQARAAYSQFIERRNIHALDVGSVLEVKLSSFPASLASSSKQQPQQHSTSSSQTPKLELSRAQQQRQRKASTASQSAVALLALNQSQQDQLLAGQCQSGGGVGAQRCRRCLVRFEHNQLAVVAPKFLLGSALYGPSSIPTPTPSGPASNCGAGVASSREPTGSGAGWLKPPTSQQQSGNNQNTAALTTQLLDETPTSSSSSSSSATNAALFHPNCFTCSTCKEFLVDLVYCLRDNKLYCVRHYGESLRPRCSWCQELIFSDEYLKAMNESFHVDHFLCRHCDTNLAGQRYVLKDEKPYCIQCYESNFANICEDCQKPIGIDSRDLSYKDRHWHDTCFLCNKCQSSLIDKPFGSKADKVYCADCYDVTFATRCDGCKNPFRAGSKKMEYRGRQWHDSCFCCCVCQNTIGSNSFIPKNDEIYCIKCYEDKYATKCTKCKNVIVSGGVTFRNEPWHRECFNCCNCNKSLAGQRFTTRDVKTETVENTNKTNQPHNAYCVDCYGDLFAKKCYACSQAITGLGGTRFVTFEDRSWHNDCFICNDCNTTLVGKGFITDGPEAILCGDCARAKLR